MKSRWYLPESRSLGNATASAYLRLLGVAAIVWFHSNTTAPLSAYVGGIGLALFVYLSFLHAGRRKGHHAAVKRLTVRLVIPWAAWWLFYAALRLWVAHGAPPAATASTSIADILTWPAAHLWYLPFIYFTSLGLLKLSSILSRMDVRKKAVLALVAALGLLPVMAVVKHTPPPTGLILYGLPAVGLGLVYGYCLRIGDRRKRLRYLVAIAALVSVACAPIWLWGYSTVATAYTGSALLMIGFAVPLPRHRFLMRLSTLTLGIYLLHPFAWRVLCKFLVVFPHLPQWITAPSTLVLAALMTWIILRIPYVRAIV